jgi:tetratricopeptide (TPR) repeat protein
MLAAMVSVLVLGLSAATWAAPVKAAEANAAEAVAAPGNGTAPAKDPKDLRMARLTKPIEDIIALAEKSMDMFKKENEKPAEKQNPKALTNFKLQAAGQYVNATNKAKAVAAGLRKDDEKQPVVDQFERPCREKAVSLLLELADAAQQRKDVSMAVGLYRQTLAIDPENATAKAALEKLAKDFNTAKKGGSKGGGTNTDPNVDPVTGQPRDYGKSGQWQMPNYSGGGGGYGGW